MESQAEKKRKASAAKKPASKKAKTDDDEALAKKLSGRRESTRDRDANKAKSKKAAALAALKKEKKIQQQQQAMEESSDESLDFGDDDDDSDDDYEESGLKPWQKKSTTKEKKSTVSRLDELSDDDMDIDEDEAPRPKARSTRAQDEPEKEAGLEDFLKVTVPRRRLARWCNEPFFKAAILECFVRLFIGEDNNGEKVYRLCEIVDVTEGKKTYKFPVTNKHDKPIATKMILKLKFGKSERDFPMYLISDAPPSEIDVQKYLAIQKDNRLSPLLKRRATKLHRVQQNLVNNYTYTTEDIEKNMELRKKQGKSLANLGLEQTKAAIAVQAAKDSIEDLEIRLKDATRLLMESSGSDENELQKNVADIQTQLDTAQKILDEKLAEEKRLKETVEDRKRRLAARHKDQNWAKVNERAVQANQRADREANKQKESDSVTASGKKKEEFNPYARRKVKPKILWEVGQDKEEDKREDLIGEEKKEGGEEAKDTLMETPGLVQEPLGKPTLSESHQFAIDEEGLVSTSTSGLIGKKKTPVHRVRKGLSLAEYLERKSNGNL